jgi:ABC-type branched-subunit amino acid transport system ATPase component
VDDSGDDAVILRLQRVGARYGAGEEVLRDVDLSLAASSFHFLVGASGAGKTSLLRLLSLSHPASRGSITLFGRDVSYQAHEMLTAGGSQGKLVSERSRPGSARSAFHAVQAASTTAS